LAASRVRHASSARSASSRARLAAARSLAIEASRPSIVFCTLGSIPRPTTKKTMPKVTASQKTCESQVAASWEI
jgi:hypothetical protein